MQTHASLTDILSALGRARVWDLAHPMEPMMPVSPNHPPFRNALLRRHGDMVRADGASAANDMITMGTHNGTHMDALCHVSQDGLMYGGVDAYKAQTGGRFNALGIETAGPFVTRGVFLDVAGYKGVDCLEPATRITADDLARTAEKAGVEVRPGDAVLVRSGWTKHWGSTPTYLGHDSGVPGPDVSAAEWLAERGVVATGHDSMAYEWLAPGAGHSLLPVHRILLVEAGIYIMENVFMEEVARDRVTEFLFMASPLKFVGATGSPVRPVAIVP